MKHSHKLLALLLALLLVLSLLPNGVLATGQKAESAAPLAEKAEAAALSTEGTRDPEEIVRVSIVLEEPSALDAGFASKDIGENDKAAAYRNDLKARQQKLTEQIEVATGRPLKVHWNLTLAVNVISAELRLGDLETVRKLPGVQDVFEESRSEAPEVQAEGTRTIPAASMIGVGTALSMGYTGAGMRIAVIDTGIDLEHQSFMAGALRYAYQQTAAEKGMTEAEYLESLNLLDRAGIEAVRDQLNSAVEPAEAWQNEKIPYGYNYVDRDLDLGHMQDNQNNHGSMLAGILAANRYVPKLTSYVPAAENVLVQGMAPDAQLLVMKVYGKGGGAYASDYFSALEDAIVLGTDVVSLAPLSGSPGFHFRNAYAEALDKLRESDTVLFSPVGNGGAWNDSPHSGSDVPAGRLLIEDVSFDTAASPGSFSGPLAVASVDNGGKVGYGFTVGDKIFFYNETAYSNAPIKTLAGSKLPYVFLDGPGLDSNDHIGMEGDDFAKLGSGVLRNKVVICRRGSSSFWAKAHAAVEQGAIGVIIVNNVEGTLNLNLSEYTDTAPVVAITMEDGDWILSQSTAVSGAVAYYTGILEVSENMLAQIPEAGEVQTFSTFSSWGVPGSLTLKPEITAVGGSLYTVCGSEKNGDGGPDRYVSVSGTTMAAAQAAGATALLQQHLKQSGLKDKTDLSLRQLSQSLLMSTATPIRSKDGYPYSILQQGAGMVNLSAALQAGAYLEMAEDAVLEAQEARDGKIKAELGDDPERTGEYSFSFTVTPFEEAQEYTLETQLFTQGYTEEAGVKYMLKETEELNADVSYEVNGLVLMPNVGFEADVNLDGQTDKEDAQAILDHLTGVGTGLYYAPAADVDADGKVTTLDAQILLIKATHLVKVTGPTEITVHIQLTDKERLDQWFGNGTYLEGFTKLVPVADREGVFHDAEHSIPILGFYGSWTDASMFDHANAVDAAYNTEKPDYLGNTETNDLRVKYPDSSEASLYLGNPYTVEESFPGDRLAVGLNTALYQFRCSLIRNAATVSPAITDQDGKVLWSQLISGAFYGAYYNMNNGSWYNTGTSKYDIGKTPDNLGLKDGDSFTVGLYAIPEYYTLDSETPGQLTKAEFEALVGSGRLGKGASLQYTLTVDSVSPEIQFADYDGHSGEIVIQASDNRYIAYISLTSLDGSTEFYGTVPEQTGPGEPVELRLKLSELEELPNEFQVMVGDYARNECAQTVLRRSKPSDFIGSMIGFTSSDVRGTGQRWLRINPDKLYFYYKDNVAVYEGTKLLATSELEVTAAEYVKGYVFMTATDGGLYVSPITQMEQCSFVGYTNGETVYDLAFNYGDYDSMESSSSLNPERTALVSPGSSAPAAQASLQAEQEPIEKAWLTAAPAVETLEAQPEGLRAASQPDNRGGSIEEDALTLTVTLTEKVDVTNGLLQVSYDPELVEFAGADSASELWSVNGRDGTVTFAFASRKALEKNQPIANLHFNRLKEGKATFTEQVLERNDQLTPDPNPTEIGGGLPCSGGDDCPGSIFTDMPPKSNWAHDPIDWAIVQGITAGTSPTTFSPNKGCTRAQVVTFLWRAAGEPAPTSDNNPFTDVKSSAYYYQPVLWAVEKGITAGTSATRFSPDATCTRAQIVTFLWRYEGTPEPHTTVNPFQDVKAGAYYEKAVLWASETGVTAGTSATKFSPDNTCTRAQVVAFLYRDLVG